MFMETERQQIQALVDAMTPITLGEMKSIRLMNRTDCKYLTNLPTLLRMLEMTRDSYYVQDINGTRLSPYATTYFDTLGEHTMYRCHETGHMPRQKVRVRTYVGSDLTFLEVKNKDNHKKTHKTRVAVSSLDAVLKNGEGEDFLESQTGLHFSDIIPTVSNRFDRITLVNHDKTERLTIDFNIHFHNHVTDAENDMENIVVVELKRDGRVPSPILPILRTLRIKPSGFSKYCIGASVTNSDLRMNRFKKRLVRIRKVAEKETMSTASAACSINQN